MTILLTALIFSVLFASMPAVCLLFAALIFSDCCLPLFVCGQSPRVKEGSQNSEVRLCSVYCGETHSGTG